MKMPCEVVIWYILPMIRRELVLELVRQEDITQSDAARILGLTPAAISQYVKGRRGAGKVDDLEVREAIEKAARRIALDKDADVSDEICSICILMREKGIPANLFEKCSRAECPAEMKTHPKSQ